MTTPEELRPHERWWQDHAAVHDGTFRGWLEDSDPWSRAEVVRIVETLGARSVLECGPGLFHDYETYWRSHPWVKYSALEMTPKLVEYGRARGATVGQGSIVAMPLPIDARDVVYCRHVLEHLDPAEIDAALSEMVRVARKAAVVVLFRTTDGANHEPMQDTSAAPGTWCNAISCGAIDEWAQQRGIRTAWTTGGRDRVLTMTWAP